MKKLILVAVLAAATTLAHAETAAQVDSSAVPGLPEDTVVQLSGEIARQIKSDHYLLRDQAGTIEVEIDDDLTSKQVLNQGVTLSVTGEVDHDDGRTLVDVFRIDSIEGAALTQGQMTDAATIQQGMAEDTLVQIKGRISKQLKHEHYLLQDDSGSIEVEIDDELTHRQALPTGTHLDLTGEVDHDDGRILVEAIRLNTVSRPASGQ